MKISKLFHWLYSILMLLPILVFIPNAFYYGFNETAVAQEKTEQVPVYYESNDVNSVDDIIYGNVYTYTYNKLSQEQSNIRYILPVTLYNVISFDNVVNRDISASITTELPFIYIFSDFTLNTSVRKNSETSFNLNSYDNVILDIVIRSDSIIQKSDYVGNLSKCDRQYIKEYQPLTTNMSITDSMSYAWDSVWQNDLFSWSYGSFLTQPFIYIGNLFNVPVDNSLYYALSYWLDISLIWLVFDVIMYVPLLVHRWLDKGIIE